MTSTEAPYCIVGAGPAGLAAARALLHAGIPVEVLERHDDVGGIWDADNPGSPMYESAHFISSKWTSGFYGFPMPDAYPDYPTHRQILEYVRAFARAFGLYEHISFGAQVADAAPVGDGWRVTLADGSQRSYAGLICANGTTWHPNVPELPGRGDFRGELRHSVSYRDPAELRGRRVLIVGGGNSGVDIACDAARNAEAAFFSVRRGYRYVPKHLFGVPTDVFIGGGAELPEGVVLPEDVGELLDVVVGDLTRLGLPAPDHAALTSHPIMNTQVLHHLSHGDLTAKPDVVGLTADGAIFADGSEEAVDLVLLATGYSWQIPYVDASLLEWKQGHPQLYLNIFHRTLAGLSVVGFVEFASAGYQRFDEMATMIAGDICAKQSEAARATLRTLKAEDAPDLRGGVPYLDTPRHANYVEVRAYVGVLQALSEQLGWELPTHDTYRPVLEAAA